MKVCKSWERMDTRGGPANARLHCMRRVCVVASLLSVMLMTAAERPADRVRSAWAVIDRGLQSGDFEHREQTLLAVGTIGGTNREAVRRVVEAL